MTSNGCGSVCPVGTPLREWTATPAHRGLELTICEWGPAEGEPPIGILHGFLEQGAAWHDVGTRVAQRLGRRVFAPDQRGFGKSAHATGPYHIWDFVADFDRVVQLVGGPIDLVGHSMGSAVAGLFAGARPELVRRLVLVEGLGPPDGTQGAVSRGQAFLDDSRQPRTHRPLDDLAAAVRRLRRPHPHLSEELAMRLAERVTERDADGVLRWRWDVGHRMRFPYPFDESIFGQYLEAITAPTLVVYGADSPYKTEYFGHREAHLRQSRRVVVPGAGHMLHYDDAEGMAALLVEHFG